MLTPDERAGRAGNAAAALSNRAAVNLDLALTDTQLADATEELSLLLRSIPQCLLERGPSLDLALRRYEQIWLPLVAQSHSVDMAPPPDVAWVWLCHQLAPNHYEEDTKKLVDVVPPRSPSALQRGTIERPAGLLRLRVTFTPMSNRRSCARTTRYVTAEAARTTHAHYTRTTSPIT